MGGADVLVNNAGVYLTFNLTDADAEKIRKMMYVNVVGLCLFNREVIKDICETETSTMDICSTFLGNVAGQYIMDYPGNSVYTSSKHSVRVLTEGMRRELRDLGTKIKITVRTFVLAQYTLTQMIQDSV
ncbi:hypothetical protein B566_EDAN000889 [Ephemera danica]|nr:hypothetical protein B566_EDAN000889 [Ephemera danica]